MVQAALYNVNNDWEKRPEGWTAADFMPKTAEELAADKAEAERAPNADELADYKARIKSAIAPR